MNININKVKIIVTVPPENVDDVREAMCSAGAGIIGNYTNCSMSTKCQGTFKPNDEANPYIGEINKVYNYPLYILYNFILPKFRSIIRKVKGFKTQ